MGTPPSSAQTLLARASTQTLSKVSPKERLVAQTAHRHLTTWLDSSRCHRLGNRWQSFSPAPGASQECQRTTPPSALTTRESSFLRLCLCLHPLIGHNRKTSVATLHRFADLEFTIITCNKDLKQKKKKKKKKVPALIPLL